MDTSATPHVASLPDFTPEQFAVKPIEQAETIPSSWYTHPAYHEIDRQAVFSRTWQAISHVSQVQSIGDCAAAVVADNPLFVVRGKDQKLRAFYNVCRHRGGPIVTEDGNCNMLKCHYHGWTYQLDGSLRGVPMWNQVELFDRSDYGLVPVTLDQWADIVWIRLEDGVIDLPALVDGIARHGSSLLAGLKFFRRVVYGVKCNWKVYADNYLEGYHVPHVHPELCDLLDMQDYRTETAAYHSLQYSPLQNAGAYGGGGSEAFYYFIWPNFMLNIIPGRLQTNRVVPVAHDHCQVIFDYFYDDIVSADAQRGAMDDINASHKIQLEDIGICEHVQRGLQSRAYDRGRFSVECEQAVYHFQSLLKNTYKHVYLKQLGECR
jgi:choline monooxygenase